MSCFVQYAPYHLAEGTWDEQREAFGDAVVDTIAEYAPNLKDLILHRQVLTPLDIERDFGLTRGQHLPGRADARAAVLPAAGARLGPLPTPINRSCAARPRIPAAASWARRAERRRADPEGRPPVSAPVVVIGGGLNGLVCATLLARAGRPVTLVEQRDAVGGAAVTRELAPGLPRPGAGPPRRPAARRRRRASSASARAASTSCRATCG